jgi:OmpA-OmpF porin, OOP family
VRLLQLLSWIPWALIGLLFLGVLGYFWKYRTKTIKESEIPTVGVLSKQDSTYVSDSAFAALPSDTSSTDFSVETPEVETPKPIEKETKKVEKIIKTQPVEKKVEESPKTDVFDNNYSTVSVSEQLKNSKSWIGLNTDFRKNSAEISSKGQLEDVAKYLKNNRKAKVIIAGGSESKGGTLAEDRAYAVRDALFEKGVSENQLSVQSSSVKNINAKVVVKIQ